ncbi:inositol monophosphatase family protein [Bradyrhizobium centrosematis]|uniref:inositol monophosphatase family protein n=1 Tax=Bradyrhizobium centrosematis TaxID=1300039 RepID=UPI00216AAA12|nr:inositol monophosphatase family protein [Bradyrhizobium centrosematis]MCS3762539.1 fructose-1,6-bisphosphatase/inositol monophosphatase family enzyme [Bradyrhizobium centrosematis]MCS3775208.1 fructose-1,6-bisphosphatase/inositol monophosphatase family enzyme [Bradyrhizobium centrosematis]
MFIIAQLSDLHVRPLGKLAYGDVDANAMFHDAIDAVLRLDPRPDCVVVSGDLTDGGLEEEYEIVAAGLTRLPMPVFVIPGNHDRREQLISSLRSRHRYLPSDGFINFVVDDFPVRLIFLDSVEAGKIHGTFCAARQQWLRDALATGRGKPTVVVIHHPPFLVGADGMDDLRLLGADALDAIIKDHPEIERVLCGHYHRSITARYAGTVGYVAPSTAHQVALDLRPGHSNRFIMEPPGFALHCWRPDTGISSHLVPVGDYGRPFEIAAGQDHPGTDRGDGLPALLRRAEAVVGEAAARLVAMQSTPLRTERKDHLDIVTEADLASEAIVVAGLKALTPKAGILAEESGASPGDNAARWIIDPLDGTINYARGLPWFSVTVAYEVDGETKLGLINAPKIGLTARYLAGEGATIDGLPARVSMTRSLSDAVISVILTSHFSPDEVQRTTRVIELLGKVVRGVRIVVSGAFETTMVASGRLDGFVSLKADIVSHAAALPMVWAGGGKVTTLTGRPCRNDDLDKIASNGLIHEELLALLRQALQ